MSLALARRLRQAIMINENTKITVGRINHNSVMLMVDAPKDVSVDRMEIYSKKHPELSTLPNHNFNCVPTKRRYIEIDLLPRNGRNSPIIRVYKKTKLPINATENNTSVTTARLNK